MDKTFFIENRQRIAANTGPEDVMLFFSGEGLRKTADEHYPFFTSRNFLYLTGIKQEQSALLMHNQAGAIHERLFALKPDPAQEVWTGRRFTDEELQAISGIHQVEDITRLNRALDTLLAAQPSTTLWLCFDPLASERAFDIEREFASSIAKRHPQVTVKNSYPLIRAQRTVKTPGEIEAIRRAMRITEAGICRMMQYAGRAARDARPVLMEYELEAEF